MSDVSDFSSQLEEIEAELNQRGGEDQIDFTLRRMVALLDLLGNPQNAYPTIHIAGTNGKTTTSRMIDALAREFSLRTGRTTSPHLQQVTERISVDGQPISAERYCEIYQEIKPLVEMVDAEHAPIQLSKFEILTAMAFMAFAEAPIDLGIIEVGLGGRLDATNVIQSKVAVITPVGFDHMNFLGDTLGEIATEKAGIIKRLPSGIIAEDQVVITAKQEPEALQAIVSVTETQDAIIAREGQEFFIADRSVAVGGQMLNLQGLGGLYDDIFLPLHGAHQAQNAAVALAAMEAFFGAGVDRKIDIDNVRAGFANVTSPGRLERIASNPTILVDAAHNPHGAQSLAAALRDEFNFSYTVGVVAILADKDAQGILLALEPVFNEVIITQNDSLRALDMQKLFEIAVHIFGTDRVAMSDSIPLAIAEAIDIAIQHSVPDPDTAERIGGGVVIAGSVVTAGQSREVLNVEMV